MMPRPSVYQASIAKINLGLHIKGRLPNGYHAIETLLYPVTRLFDDLTVSAAADEPEPVLLTSGMAIPGGIANNLVLKAFRLVLADYPQLPNVRVRLHKRIPAGAGLGGGSSNAACMLLALNQLFQLEMPDAQMLAYARELGADVPFFLKGTPQLASGIGDVLMPYDVDLPYDIRVVTSGIHSNTAEAYQGLNLAQCSTGVRLGDCLAQPVGNWKANLCNDFETSVFGRYPLLAKLKEKLYSEGAVYAAMSGSGSALFGLFEKA